MMTTAATATATKGTARCVDIGAERSDESRGHVVTIATMTSVKIAVTTGYDAGTPRMTRENSGHAKTRTLTASAAGCHAFPWRRYAVLSAVTVAYAAACWIMLAAICNFGHRAPASYGA